MYQIIAFESITNQLRRGREKEPTRITSMILKVIVGGYIDLVHDFIVNGVLAYWVCILEVGVVRVSWVWVHGLLSCSMDRTLDFPILTMGMQLEEELRSSLILSSSEKPKVLFQMILTSSWGSSTAIIAWAMHTVDFLLNDLGERTPLKKPSSITTLVFNLNSRIKARTLAFKMRCIWLEYEISSRNRDMVIFPLGFLISPCEELEVFLLFRLDSWSVRAGVGVVSPIVMVLWAGERCRIGDGSAIVMMLTK